MKTASISSAKNQLSALVKRVQRGEPILITDHGVPVAKLVPVQLGAGVSERVIALARPGLARLPARVPDSAWLHLPRPMPTAGASVVDLLLQERGVGR